MPTTRFWQVDVFALRPGGGNPLGVVLGADGWSDARMQGFARWTQLVETTYLLQPRHPEASYRLRIFTPEREIAFAGHPTVGSAHVALESGLLQPQDTLIQECGAGLLPLRVQGSGRTRQIAVRAPAARIVQSQTQASGLLAIALADRRLGALGCALLEGGRRWWLAELANENEVRQWQPEHARIADLAAAEACLGLCVFARCTIAGQAALVVRAFPAGVGIIEDPASGAANGLIAAWIASAAPDSDLARGYTVSQGREMGKDARLEIEIASPMEIWVGGACQTIIAGALHWPDAS